LNAGDEGGSLVEFALVLPMMLMLITGLFSVGLFLNSYMMLTNGIGAGARAFALSRGVTVTNSNGTTSPITDPCAYAVQTAQQAAPNLNQSGVTFAITWTPNGGTATSYSTTCSGITLHTGDTVEVAASYPAVFILYGWRPGTMSIGNQSTQLVQ
jgi:Flp pilus assembly protein TadG